MGSDSRGHPISSESDEAVAAVNSAIQHLVGRRAAFTPSINEAKTYDPECVMAQVLSGLMACGLRKEGGLAAAREAYAIASAQRPRVTPRERLYIDVLEASIARDAVRVVQGLEAVLDTHPTDLLASVMVQGELFWTGEMQRSEAISARCDAHWSSDVDGHADWLALRAFDLEEIGQLDAAERCGRQCVEQDPDNLWGAHAVAHVLEMRGDSAGGIRWLDQLKQGWDAGGPMKFHLWWHRALCHIEEGEHDAALDIHDQWLRNAQQPIQQALPDFYLDVQNGASNLVRLELQGVDPGERWHALGDAVEPSWDDLSNPFTTLHVAMVLAATEQWDRFGELLRAVILYARSEQSVLSDAYRDAPSVIRAIGAHRAGDYQQVVDQAADLRQAFWRFGGSHAQRDVLFQILFDAARRCKDDALMQHIGADLERIGFVDPLQRVAYRPVA